MSLLRSGVPIKVIGDVLGHTSAAATAEYLKLATEDRKIYEPSAWNCRAGCRHDSSTPDGRKAHRAVPADPALSPCGDAQELRRNAAKLRRLCFEAQWGRCADCCDHAAMVEGAQSQGRSVSGTATDVFAALDSRPQTTQLLWFSNARRDVRLWWPGL